MRHLPQMRVRRATAWQTVNVRTSRGTTGAGHHAVLPRETRPSGEAEAGTLAPPWWCWASTTGARRSWPRMQAARSPCTARWPKRPRRSSMLRWASPWISRPSARPPIATLRDDRAAQQSAACGLLDNVTGKRVVVSLDEGTRPRPREAQEAWPQDEEGAQPIPYRLPKEPKSPHPVRRRRRRATVSDVGPDHRRHAPGTGGGLRTMLLSYARQIGLDAADKVLCIADGAPWIWRRLQRLIAATRGYSPAQVLGLIDFYHAIGKATLGRGQAAPLERDPTHPLAQPHAGAAHQLEHAWTEVITGPAGAVPRTAHRRQDPHAPQLLPEEPASFRLHHNGRTLGLPRGSGAVESAIRRVNNLGHQGRIHLLAAGERRRDSSPTVNLMRRPANRTVCTSGAGQPDAGSCERFHREIGNAPGWAKCTSHQSTSFCRRPTSSSPTCCLSPAHASTRSPRRTCGERPTS